MCFYFTNQFKFKKKAQVIKMLCLIIYQNLPVLFLDQPTNPEVRHIWDIDFVFTKITCVPLLALGI